MKSTATTTDRSVASGDGTRISFDISGDGPPIVIVAAALSGRGDTKRLAHRLAPQFTIVNHDRRGRGSSGDTPTYDVAHEIEDIEALITSVGGRAALFGSSSGAVLALHAADKLAERVTGLVMYEPPFITDDSRPSLGAEFRSLIDTALAAGDRRRAVRRFMTDGMGMPASMVAMMRWFPGWKAMVDMAHTLPYDLDVMGDTQNGKPLRPEQWCHVTMPTLVLTGAKSEAFFHHGASQLAIGLPNARHERLAKSGHSTVVASPGRVADAITAFLNSCLTGK